MNLQGKVAIITGASSGIGEAIALQLAEQGVQVVLSARRVERLENLARKIEEKSNAFVVQADVTKKEEVENVVKKAQEAFGRIDFLINNAGVMYRSFLKNDHVEEWEKMIDVNIKGVLYGIHAVLPKLIEQGSGHIVNVSSVAGHEISRSNVVYGATKYAVRGLSMGLEKELAKTGVRVTNVSPGMVETELSGHTTDEEVLEISRNHQSTVNPLEPGDIARAVSFALSQPENVNVNEVTVRPMHHKQ